MCTGRVDLSFILRAFSHGADGVFIGGCWPGECHYVTEGNYDALGNVHLGKKLLAHLGVNPERLRLEWLAASEGTRFAEVMNDFAKQATALGPSGTEAAAVDAQVLQARLEAALKLVPYIKLVERERLRVSPRSEQAYHEFYRSAETDRLFHALIGDKLTMSQILALLEQQPLSTAEIAASLGLPPSEVSRHINSSSRHGLVLFDTDHNRYALARGAQ